MGILDDAIREHLELKRKHGVPEDELQRQEEEALGPARREVAQQHEDGEPEAAEAAAEDEAIAQADDGRGARRRPGNRAVRHGGRGADASRTPGRGRPSSRLRPTRPSRTRRSSATRSSSRTRTSSSRSKRSLEPDEGELEPDEEELLSRRGGVRRRGRRRGRARGHARLPPGDAGARPALVRAEAASRLRLRLGSSSNLRRPCGELRRGVARPGDPPLCCNSAASRAA